MTAADFRAARKALGYTSRAHIAAALDVSEPTIQRWESAEDDLPRLVEMAMRTLPKFK